MIREFQSMRIWLQDMDGKKVAVKRGHEHLLSGTLQDNSNAPGLWQVSGKANFWVFYESEIWSICNDTHTIILKDWPPFSD